MLCEWGKEPQIGQHISNTQRKQYDNCRQGMKNRFLI